MNSLFCLAVLCSVLAVNIQAQQHNGLIGDLRLSFAKGYPEAYCKEFGTGDHWALGQSTTENCFECTCSDPNGGILCIGLGYQDETQPPAGCVKRTLQDFEMGSNESCCYQMVKENNQAEVCGEKVCAP